MLYLSSDDVARALVAVDPIDAMREVFELHASQRARVADEAYLAWNESGDVHARSLSMPGCIEGKTTIVGTKVINADPRNVGAGANRAHGLLLLFDPITARIVCVLQGSYVSALRTAAVSALAVDRLAVDGVTRLGLLGAGRIGRVHLEVVPSVLPDLKTVAVFDLSETRARHCVDEFNARGAGGDVEARVAASAEAAVRGANVVITTTTTTRGYIAWSWLLSGAVVVNVSLDDLLPECFMNASLVIVDDWQLVSSDTRRTLGKLHRAGVVCGPKEHCLETFAGRRIDAELGELFTGRHRGRSSPTDTIVVNPFGMAIEDLALAARIVPIARELGLGVELAD